MSFPLLLQTQACLIINCTWEMFRITMWWVIGTELSLCTELFVTYVQNMTDIFWHAVQFLLNVMSFMWHWFSHLHTVVHSQEKLSLNDNFSWNWCSGKWIIYMYIRESSGSLFISVKTLQLLFYTSLLHRHIFQVIVSVNFGRSGLKLTPKFSILQN